MMPQDKDNRTPLEKLVRLGWDALESARKEPLSLDKLAQNAMDTLETARRGLFDETALKSFTFNAPLDNATSARVELELSVGESRIAALPTDSPLLIEALVHYLGALSFGVGGDAQRHAHLRQSAALTVSWANPLHWATRAGWQVGLTPRVPLDLRVQGGVGDADVNLSGLNLSALRVDGNIGGMSITLPSQPSVYPVVMRGAAGAMALNIPDHAAANVEVRGGVGGLAVNIANGAAVQINVQGGVGRTLMKAGFMKVEAAAPLLPNTGVWETENFSTANERVTVYIAEGLLGNISVRVLR